MTTEQLQQAHEVNTKIKHLRRELDNLNIFTETPFPEINNRMVGFEIRGTTDSDEMAEYFAGPWREFIEKYRDNVNNGLTELESKFANI